MKSEPKGKIDTAGVAHGEEWGTTSELLRVRNALRALPRARCPEGFEFRLQRRIEGRVPRSREESPVRSWGLGWAGVGLGVVTSLVLALIIFDFDLTSSGGAQVAGSALNPPIGTNPVADPTGDVATDQAATKVLGPADVLPQVASDDRDAAAKDSGKKGDPADLPQGLYHVVGGSGR